MKKLEEKDNSESKIPVENEELIIENETFSGSHYAREKMDDGTNRSLLDGDKILVKELDSDYFRTKLKDDSNFFVIIHRTDGIVVKQIIEHKIEEGIIRCHSINPSPQYHDFEIDLREVSRIFKVAAIVGRKFK